MTKSAQRRLSLIVWKQRCIEKETDTQSSNLRSPLVGQYFTKTALKTASEIEAGLSPNSSQGGNLEIRTQLPTSPIAGAERLEALRNWRPTNKGAIDLQAHTDSVSLFISLRRTEQMGRSFGWEEEHGNSAFHFYPNKILGGRASPL